MGQRRGAAPARERRPRPRAIAAMPDPPQRGGHRAGPPEFSQVLDRLRDSLLNRLERWRRWRPSSAAPSRARLQRARAAPSASGRSARGDAVAPAGRGEAQGAGMADPSCKILRPTAGCSPKRGTTSSARAHRRSGHPDAPPAAGHDVPPRALPDRTEPGAGRGPPPGDPTTR